MDGRVEAEARTARLLPSLGAAVHAAAVPSHAASRMRSISQSNPTRSVGDWGGERENKS